MPSDPPTSTRRTALGALSIAAVAALGAWATTAASAAQLHAGDMLLQVIDGRITTGEIPIKGGAIESPVRVFGARFGDSGFPGFTSDPGFDALPGTFVPGTRVGFNAVGGFLAFEGAGLVAPASETLRVSFLSLAVTIGAEPTPGFDLAVQPNGGFHRHVNFQIQTSDGAPPAPGIYVLELAVYSTDPAVEASEPLWIVFDFEQGAIAQAEAIAWVEQHLIGSACLGDLDGDGTVGGADLATLLGGWGACPGCPGDLDGDGSVGGADLAVLLGAWGPCP